MAGWKTSLLSELKQILWALLLVYLILAVFGYLFGRQIGYEDAFPLVLALAAFITISFFSVFLFLVLLTGIYSKIQEGIKRRKNRQQGRE
jgi:cation transporter-like permease